MRNFDIEKFTGNRDGLSEIMEWPRRTNKANGLWICGETRHGKTRALYAVLQQCLRHDPKVMDSAEFSSFARDAAMSKEGEDASLTPLVTRGIFAIDDLGKRMTKVGWETLFTLIDRRMNNALPTLFTANFKPREIAKLLPDSLKDACISEPLIERIRESCIQVIL
jgi:DNA replication protein DnaC